MARASAEAFDRRLKPYGSEMGLDSLSYPILRDISLLEDPSESNSTKQDILCRKGCIIIGFKQIRALVLPECAYLFPNAGFDGEKQVMDGVLTAADPHLAEDSFEYVVLSAIFSVVVQSFTKQLSHMTSSFKPSPMRKLDLEYETLSSLNRDSEHFLVELDAVINALDLHNRGAQGMVISIDPFIAGKSAGEKAETEYVKNPKFMTEVSRDSHPITAQSSPKKT